jgi:hypothetical protein
VIVLLIAKPERRKVGMSMISRLLWRTTLSSLCALLLVATATLSLTSNVSAASQNHAAQVVKTQPQHAHIALDFDSGQCTQASPAILYTGSIWYVAWIGCDGSARLNIEQVIYSNGILAQGTKYTFGATLGAGAGPALAFHFGLPMIAWVGTNEQIYTAFFNSGSLIDAFPVPGASTVNTPAMTDSLGILYVSWTGTDAAGHLNFISSTNGVSWGNFRTVSDSSIDGPALATLNGLLYVSWSGTDASFHLNIANYFNQNPLGNKITFPYSSKANVGMVRFNSVLEIGYTCAGALEWQCLYLVTYTANRTWSQAEKCYNLQMCSQYGPGVGADASRVLIVWEQPCHYCVDHGDWHIEQA